jgi:hypothetical protein
MFGETLPNQGVKAVSWTGRHDRAFKFFMFYLQDMASILFLGPFRGPPAWS